MVRATELAGFIGAGLAGLAYIPQIWHLIHERCSAGLSRLAFSLWLTASILVTSHAVAIGAGVFIAIGAVQLAATGLILVYTTKYAGSYCASHLPCQPHVGAACAPPGHVRRTMSRHAGAIEPVRRDRRRKAAWRTGWTHPCHRTPTTMERIGDRLSTPTAEHYENDELLPGLALRRR